MPAVSTRRLQSIESHRSAAYKPRSVAFIRLSLSLSLTHTLSVTHEPTIPVFEEELQRRRVNNKSYGIALPCREEEKRRGEALFISRGCR